MKSLFGLFCSSFELLKFVISVFLQIPGLPLFFFSINFLKQTSSYLLSLSSLERASMVIGWFKKFNSRTVFQWPWSWSISSSSPSPSGSSWRGFHLGFSLVDDLLFQILYCVESVVLVFALCFFFLCCGCNI